MTQAMFTVPATAVYVSASNGGRYRYVSGDLIPLDRAIDLAMPGASAAAATTPFSAAEDAWLETRVAAESVVGPTGATGATGPTGPTGATGPTGPTGGV